MGVDASEEALRFAHAKQSEFRLVHGSLERLPFPSNSFDAVFALDVIEHIQNDKAAVQEMYRVLGDNGLAVFTVPAFGWLWSKFDLREHHVRRYRRAPLAAILTHAGFAIKKITYFNTFLFPLIAPAKILSRIREPKFLPASEIRVPRFLNKLFTIIFAAEARPLRKFNFPFGISILAIAYKTPRF